LVSIVSQMLKYTTFILLFLSLASCECSAVKDSDTSYSGDTLHVKHYDKHNKVSWEEFHINDEVLYYKIWTYFRDSSYAFIILPPFSWRGSPYYTEEFYPDGTLKIKGYQKGRKGYGLIESFYPNGNPKCQCNFYGRKKSGKSKVYYENGQLESEGDYHYNKPIGTRKYYHDNGTLWLIEKYKNNRLVSISKSYNSKGQEVELGTIDTSTMTGYVNYYDYDGSLLARTYYRKGRELFQHKVRGRKRYKDYTIR